MSFVGRLCARTIRSAISRVPSQNGLIRLPLKFPIPTASRLSVYSFSTTAESVSADDATLVHEPKVDEEAPEDAAVVKPAPMSKVKLFVGNLPWELEDRALHELFKPFSPNHSRVARFPDSGKSKGFGFVRFSDSESAQAALRELHGSEFHGRAIAVAFKGPKGSQINSVSKLFVGNLPWTVDVLELKEKAGEFGEVRSANIVTDPETGLSRGFGFVTMINEEQAQHVIAQLHGTEMQGRVVSVSEAGNGKKAPRVNVHNVSENCKLYVGNISWDLDLEDLKGLFSEFGEVLAARIITDHESGRSRGFGFVTMSNEDQAQAVVSELDQSDVAGRVLAVSIAGKKTTRQSNED